MLLAAQRDNKMLLKDLQNVMYTKTSKSLLT